MVRKLLIIAFAIAFLGSSFLMPLAEADGGRGKGSCHKDLDEKIYYKAYFIMKNQDELGVEDAQLADIKALKIETKKEMVKKDAEIDLVKIDIYSGLYEDKIDTKKVNGLIDKKYELKKEKAKYLVRQYSALKNMLSEEQKEKMKTLRKKCDRK